MKKLIIAVLLCALAFSGCGKKEKSETKTAPDVKTEQKADNGKEDKNTEAKKEEKSENEAAGSVPSVTGDELAEMADEFNSLEDGDPKKEELREKLEAILSQAEQLN